MPIIRHKINARKECDICHYRYFLDKDFKFRPYISDENQDVLVMSINLNNIAILIIYSIDYCCINNGIDKSEAINLLQIADLTERTGLL